MKQPGKVRIHLTVDNRELDTIIAALRWWQQSGGTEWEQEIATEHGPALTPAAVENLIERIN